MAVRKGGSSSKRLSLKQHRTRVQQAGEFSEERAALVAQNRIIVRTVHLALEVDDVADSIEEISQSVQGDGGWVVSTDRSSKHYGFISVRVPAAKLDDALKWMRQLGVDVLSEASTSTDVTDEYYDLRSRVTSLQATEEALIRLLDRAADVEDALEVQRELARVQVEVEAHLGRIKLLEETAAFSLVNISLNLAPQDMRVDAGEDMTFSVGENGRDSGRPSTRRKGIDDFRLRTWDFGDGSRVETRYGKRAEAGRRANYGDRPSPVQQRPGISVYRRSDDDWKGRGGNCRRIGHLYRDRFGTARYHGVCGRA